MWEIPQNYHTLALFDPTKMGNSTIPVLQYAQNPQESANIGKHAELFFSKWWHTIGEIEKQFLFQNTMEVFLRQAWMWLTYVNMVKIANCNNDHVNRNEHPAFLGLGGQKQTDQTASSKIFGGHSVIPFPWISLIFTTRNEEKCHHQNGEARPGIGTENHGHQ